MLSQVHGLELADGHTETLSHSILHNQIFPDIRYAEDSTFCVFFFSTDKSEDG